MAALLCISAERQGAPAPLVALHWFTIVEPLWLMHC